MNHRTILIASIAFALFPVALSAQTTIPAAANSNFNANAAGTSYILNTGNTRAVTSGATEAITIGAASGSITLTVDGIASQTATGRAIRSSTGGASITVNIGSTGLVKAVTDDAIQGRNTGAFNLTNLGTLYSGPNISVTPSTALTTGRGLNLRDAGGGTVFNGSVSNSTALIRADGGDAVRVGVGFAFTNYGVINAAGIVNDNSANNGFNSSPNNSVATTFGAGGGFSFEDPSGIVGSTNSSLVNYGTVTGARHGVQSGTLGSNLTVTNQATGSIIGRNGSGIGFDSIETNPAKIIVHNYGLIRGDFAGIGNVIDRTGSASFTHDGDGDGVDIDGAATVNNYAGGQIRGTGANGYDTGGRANTSDGIAIGGGIINNSGLIQGTGVGIVVNNDTSLTRSGVAATTITNNVGGTIEGQNGYAIRLENKLGDARDNDTITNYGTIIGGGTITKPSGTVALQGNGGTDTNSTGTLDGVTYTGTGSARFIKGDGSAIQTGEGNDIITNHGTITGSNGRAINMEGGSNTLNIAGGTITGAINGGTGGTNALNVNLSTPSSSFAYSGAITNFATTSVQNGIFSLSGSINDSSAISIATGGTFNYTGAGALGNNITLNGGNFKNNGGNFTGTLTLASGTVGGTNLSGVALSIGAGVTLSPGNSPGTMATGSQTWAGGGSYLWEINRLAAAGGAQGNDPGWDFADITGTLNITANAGNKFHINIDSLGLLSSWDGGHYYAFNFATASGGIFGFDASDFLIDTSAFADQHYIGDGFFSVSQHGNSLELDFTPVPEPATIGIGIALMGVAFIRRRRGA
ncbi:MAG: PEP-CTERM sorting domain-containing protein [Verrucomicrobia bacterium]|nr:PEP-CTERM sorting domain-containing protein [Verrucomicrobiota bacterium]